MVSFKLLITLIAGLYASGGSAHALLRWPPSSALDQGSSEITSTIFMHPSDSLVKRQDPVTPTITRTTTVAVTLTQSTTRTVTSSTTVTSTQTNTSTVNVTTTPTTTATRTNFVTATSTVVVTSTRTAGRASTVTSTVTAEPEPTD